MAAVNELLAFVAHWRGVFLHLAAAAAIVLTEIPQ
jgi:hypothetical protein